MRLTTAGLLSYAAFVGCVLTRVSCCILRCVPALLLLLQAVRTPLGAFQQVTVCSRCEGQGQSFQACERCGGDGRERESKRIQLTVPAGVCVAGGGGMALDTSCWAGRRQESWSVTKAGSVATAAAGQLGAVASVKHKQLLLLLLLSGRAATQL